MGGGGDRCFNGYGKWVHAWEWMVQENRSMGLAEWVV